MYAPLGAPELPTAAESELSVHQILKEGIENEEIGYSNKVLKVVDRIRQACVGRVFFMTTDGTPGLGPLAGREGDIVTVILGCRSPMLLRSTTGGYKVIGEVYYDGFMCGEALLGPLPNSFEAVLRSDNHRGFRWAYRNKGTGVFQREYPGAGTLHNGWTLQSHEHEELWDVFVNVESGEETCFDPRLASEELRKRGVPIQVFDLI
jgi:hypothetical protein